MGAMLDAVFDYLFDAASFMPHGVCLAWRPDLVALHVISDIGIFLAYASIPVALFYFVNKRKDLQYKRVFVLFGVFILACGATHAFGALTLWHPLYGLQGMVKLMTALVSIMTAVLIWPILPKALALPSPVALRQAVNELTQENQARRKVEAELRASRDELEQRVEERTRDLKKSEQRFRDFAESSADWFWEQDEKLRFTYVSAENEEITGVGAKDYFGKTRRETGITGVSEEDLAVHEAMLEKHLPFADFRYQRRSPTGEVLYISVSGRPIFDENGDFQGYRGAAHNVTHAVEAEAIIKAERDRAEEASRAKSAFLANMSHEFRTPLNGIIGYLEILSSDVGKTYSRGKTVEIIEDLQIASRHLLSLINDVLDLSRVESGIESPMPEGIDVGSVVRNSAELVAAMADEKSIELDLRVDPAVPEVWVDSRHLHQILINLLSNAVKYTDAGGRVQVRAQQEQQGFVSISVADNGIGIPPSDLTRVFESFERGEDVMTSGTGGTGLGLPLAKRLVEINGGTITLESDHTIGTTVTVTLPVSGQ